MFILIWQKYFDIDKKYLLIILCKLIIKNKYIKYTYN